MTLDDPKMKPAPSELGGFHSALGYRQVSWEDGCAVIDLSLHADHLNLAGVVHGGVLSALLDIAMAQAGTYCPYPNRIRKAITLSMTITFTGQCSGGVIRVTGRKRAGGRRIYNCTGEVHDAAGNLLAISEGTFRTRTGSDQPEGVPV
ncbi:PaaI family thioesterase [Marinobacter sp. SS21]|uniref:PaaI family thioesterase n=1 Tax=Marinobacter sp. SS21 TaxID=2979460 RepID=UPI00232E8EE9|nr:PaaI family thioesterase [Marinobacter sp. SS21]MDC0661167.1 PaaI family thioesterase [Marinobacter sp. SS21]